MNALPRAGSMKKTDVTSRVDSCVASLLPGTINRQNRDGASSDLVEIRVLSVRQPFASHLIFPHPKLGRKWLDNRSWTHRYRGQLFIHCSRWESKPHPDQCDQPLDQLWSPAGPQPPAVGAIIGSVDLIHSASQHDIEECYDVMTGQSRRKLTPEQRQLLKLLPDPTTRAGEKAWLWYDGSAALIVGNPRALEVPIPTGGKLQLWKFHVPSDRLKYVSD